MKTMIAVLALSMVAGAVSIVVGPNGAKAQEGERPALVTQAEYERWQKELSNWGRWGANDELGALNLITPAKRRQAAGLVKDGVTVSLASNLSIDKGPDVPCPVEWSMINASPNGASDRIGFPCIHGAGTTHLDAFAHVFFGGKMWNGYDVAATVSKEKGAAKGAILNFKNGIVTRGVLYDIPRLKGVPFLEPGIRVTVADLEAWEKKSGVRVGAGDAMLFRWGRWTRRAKLGVWPINAESAGLDNSVMPWLRKRDIAILGWETPGYAPAPPGDLPGLPLHNFVLTILGVPLIDRADFDAAAEVAAARNRWEFMLTIAPLPVPNGTGSPVNPIATF
jgi:kynurenine formamidase